MKYLLTIGLNCLMIASLFGSATIIDFSGYSETSRVVIQWTSVAEQNLQGYEIQRSMDGQTFNRLGFLDARGSNTGYTYVDDSVFAKLSGRVYYYRLKIVNANGSIEYSGVITIESQISSAKHTWGSIKAMFK
ncbi:MAG: hypothetical protein COY19_07835 [Candidatus Marinimicrobia bacterium CG_4_10_14_0_2_um_filter_48_9]|nr:MAG: hypothetical protein COY19_07835 [Candidatus Marinimicrobia bacterium CG_4_10_14_0_2_um_filter_48_9]